MKKRNEGLMLKFSEKLGQETSFFFDLVLVNLFGTGKLLASRQLCWMAKQILGDNEHS